MTTPKPTWRAALEQFIAFLLSITLGGLGGVVFLSHDAPFLRGIGLSLIVLVPRLWGELLKERPPKTPGRRTTR